MKITTILRVILSLLGVIADRSILALGVSMCLMGAFVIVVGESILGEAYGGIAAVIGIVGLCLVTKSRRREI